MATAEQLKALLKSHVEGDEDRFLAVAIQVAAQAARQGHAKLAVELRDLVDKAKVEGAQRTGSRAPVPLTQPRGDLAGLLSVAYPKARLSDLVLDSSTRSRLHKILLEQRQRAKLQAHGLQPRRKILLVGPPGTGKTFTARALAGELHLPLFTILLDGVITKFMGETAAKLRLVFDSIGRTRGVYLFDELDALGGDRGAGNDVGEARRALSSFLQFLEEDESEGLLLAATNHVELLDRALFRRFDDVIEFTMPDDGLAIEVMKTRLAMLDVSSVQWGQVGAEASGLSHAELAKACDDAAKDAILGDDERVTTAALVAEVGLRKRSRRAT